MCGIPGRLNGPTFVLIHTTEKATEVVQKDDPQMIGMAYLLYKKLGGTRQKI